MHKRDLDKSTRVGAIGLGCMGMSWAYGKDGHGEAEHVRVIHRAIERGATLIDTADVYGPHTNEELVGRALAGRRERAVVATKVGLVHTGDERFIAPVGTPAHVRTSIDASLQRLRIDHVDLYQLHRVDPAVPIEETWGAMAEIVRAGKARAIGLSEVTVAQLERAQSVFPVASVQSELSLWTRDFARDVVPWCAAHGVAFIAYAPLGRGYLTGRFQRRDDFSADDWRLTTPRFSQTALAENQRLVSVVQGVAERVGATPAQVALAWVLARGEHVIPIPGTRSTARLDENLDAAAVRLSADDLAELDAMPAAVGGRYA